MTTAHSGLAAALARTASGTVMALAEMSAADLLDSLGDDQKADLSAALAAAAPPPANAAHGEPDKNEPDGDPDDTKCSKCKGPMKDGKCTKCAPDSKASAAEPGSFAAANDRALAVMASEHFAGREKLAATLLANDKLSAGEIVAALAATTAPAAAAGDPDAAAREEMKAALAAQKNSQIDPTGAGTSASKQDSASIWDQAHSLNGFTPPKKNG